MGIHSVSAGRLWIVNFFRFTLSTKRKLELNACIFLCSWFVISNSVGVASSSSITICTRYTRYCISVVVLCFYFSIQFNHSQEVFLRSAQSLLIYYIFLVIIFMILNISSLFFHPFLGVFFLFFLFSNLPYCGWQLILVSSLDYLHFINNHLKRIDIYNSAVTKDVNASWGIKQYALLDNFIIPHIKYTTKIRTFVYYIQYSAVYIQHYARIHKREYT